MFDIFFTRIFIKHDRLPIMDHALCLDKDVFSRVSMYIDGHKDGILFNLNSWKKWVICRKIVQNGTFLLKLVLTEEIRKNNVRVIKRI